MILFPPHSGFPGGETFSSVAFRELWEAITGFEPETRLWELIDCRDTGEGNGRCG